MKLKQSRAFIALMVSIVSGGALSCGSSAGTGNDNLANATGMTIVNATKADDFSTSGNVNIGFVATDSSGNAILAQNTSGTPLRVAIDNIVVRSANAADGDITCSISSAFSTTITCTFASIATVSATTGTGSWALDIDSSGSMSGSDPSCLRVTASNSFYDELEADSASNQVAAYDFTTDSSLDATGCTGARATWAATTGFTDTSELLDWSATTSANNAAFSSAVATVGDGAGTPLYDSMTEVCTDMATNSSITSGNSKYILLLSDGDDSGGGSSSLADLNSCLSTNDITAYVIGLGSGAIDSVLQSIADANGGLYRPVSAASELAEVFAAFATAVNGGYNNATVTLSVHDSTVTGVEITITISIDGTSATDTVTITL
ncbi:MAG: VWA domain-containing protein [Deltaproteobacteria bacterium]|nr:VWA domain-containing protein [Deltaproteobacteria bacterium]